MSIYFYSSGTFGEDYIYTVYNTHWPRHVILWHCMGGVWSSRHVREGGLAYGYQHAHHVTKVLWYML
jgi:hypothetical protein